MQRTFITEKPESLAAEQVVVDTPRYARQLAAAFLRRDTADYSMFDSDATPFNHATTINHVKRFVDELSREDEEIDTNVRVPYGNYVGIKFANVAEAVRWARSFVARHFPGTEERFLKKALLNIPFEKTEIVWVGGDKYLPFVRRVATSPSTETLVQAVPANQHPNPVRTPEEARKRREELAAKRGKKEDATVTP